MQFNRLQTKLWDYAIADGVFIITNRQVQNMQYSYNSRNPSKTIRMSAAAGKRS